ncbi:tripartite tricarboxylate transporter TctB family protein [Acuticoccus sp. M5D2P5]|uniref:tripartite tricarboxylate transporter TctB family protein n=1 Tax=Acuticoccus kalidii TaxID=2910977 RepID=UPI001F1AC50A|nr:tripartite tricarboxylate transporter TctB family protein [Acuticoccus kalidii]MCF3932696.1 tripartite tricarboxylate transporter TctB family protein [Acuticoccus kalidii]
MSSTPRADFVFSMLLTVLGVAVIVESVRMPRLQELGVDPMSAPGLTPGLLGVILTGLGIALFARSVRAAPVAGEAEGGWGRLALALGLCLLYAAGLVGRMPFMAATGIFVFLFVAAFSWGRASAARMLMMALALAVGTAVLVTFLFEKIFLVRLP